MRIIVAVDENWGIGKDGTLLCHLSGDLKYFKEKTLGKTLVMGRATLESLPGSKGLPERRNIVLSRNENYFARDAETVSSEDELWSALTGTDPEDVMVIGGGEIYKALLPFCDKCYVTKIYKSFDADTFFPNLDEIPEFESQAVGDIAEEDGIRYQFFEYDRTGLSEECE